MIIHQVVGKLAELNLGHHHGNTDFTIERVILSWDELHKRILRKTTDVGREIGIQLENGHLHPGDILHREGKHVIIVEVKAEAVLVVSVGTMRNMGLAAHAIGNMHAPVEITAETIITPYNSVLAVQLQKLGLETQVENRPFAP
ncbi:urease accessory protein UreE [Sporomusa sp.]|jgi:urease accessory protein|uniref:urease accessory protein UreE n=1 Tax=Sporomusa sp. TaxID=2078658 RepID=UPI002CEBC4F8|nr:urease accessory protein UreE [Sporomusa sp.]MDF2873396.1 ureE [Sporomusa sp.]HWR05807.1 urease accessory protein UreE [Sporomusa sp.]